jgi:hypothetical protein
MTRSTIIVGALLGALLAAPLSDGNALGAAATAAAWIGAMLALLAAAAITLGWLSLRNRQRLYGPATECAEA